MNNEKRQYDRVSLEISITLKRIASPYEVYNYDGITIDAYTLNLSPKGIAFKTNAKLEVNSTYMASIHYKDFNPFVIMINVVNEHAEDDNGLNVYGCKFEGINRNLLTNPLFNELYSTIEFSGKPSHQ